MTKHEMIVCILLAIVTTNLIRILPMVLIKGRIQNVFLRSFLYYVPYVTLAVMTFPAIVESTMSPYAGIAALLMWLAFAAPWPISSMPGWHKCPFSLFQHKSDLGQCLPLHAKCGLAVTAVAAQHGQGASLP